MLSAYLSLSFLVVLAFSCAAWLAPWFQGWSGNQGKSGNVLAVLMGDSRRLFAQHFFLKADAYFHSGYYPSIFDTSSQSGQPHIAAHAEGGHKEDEDMDSFLGKPKDWLDRFSRHFYPTEHRHLGEDDDGDHDGHLDGKPGEEREMLPWLRLAVELDPQRPETYVVASFWLRSRLNRVNEAEQFLREGLRHNPGNSDILFELGRIFRENRQDNDRARNLWELALKKWHETQATQAEPNQLLHAQLLGNLARLEEATQHYPRAVEYLEELKTFSPHQQSLDRWIAGLKRKNAR